MITGIITGFLVSTTLYIIGVIFFFQRIKQLKAKILKLEKMLARKTYSTDIVSSEYYLIQSAWGYYALSPDPNSCYWVTDPYKALRFSDAFDLDMFLRSSQYCGGSMFVEKVKLHMWVI